MRRLIFLILIFLFVGLCVLAVMVGLGRQTVSEGSKAQIEKVYQDFLRRHLAADGRIVDNGNADVSHSEGQGYGMLFAAGLGDREVFDRIAGWTEEQLGGRADGLLSWKWVASEDGGEIADANNATDGDMLVAWGYLLAFDRWHRQADRDAAIRHLQAIAEHAVVDTDVGMVILPGVSGFVHEDRITLNLSYWVYPALRRFERADPDGPWRTLIDSGLRLMESASTGEYALVPDWIEVTGGHVSPAQTWPPEFGFNAIRIPIHLCGKFERQQRVRAGKLLDTYAEYFAARGDKLTTQWNVLTDGPAGYPAGASYQTVASFAESGCREIPEQGEPSGLSLYYDDALTGLVTLVQSVNGT